MVLILPYMLIAALRFFRRGQQVFPKGPHSPPPPPPPPPPPSLFFLPQEALLSFGSVIEICSLREVIKDAIASVLPKVERVFVYLLDEEAGLTCSLARCTPTPVHV
uniref:Uncharacterized protein n=1 Tax=Naja naja TaxID=35670 RepID=A0A8C6XH21_NAJNA